MGFIYYDILPVSCSLYLVSSLPSIFLFTGTLAFHPEFLVLALHRGPAIP